MFRSVYFVKQVNEYKNKSINTCHDRRRFKNKIVRDNTLAVSPICSSLKQLDLARMRLGTDSVFYSIRVSYRTFIFSRCLIQPRQGNSG